MLGAIGPHGNRENHSPFCERLTSATGGTCTFDCKLFSTGGLAVRISQYSRALGMLRNSLLPLALFTFLVAPASPGEQRKPVPAARLEHTDDRWAAETLKTLSIEQKVGQLFMIRLKVDSLKGHGRSYYELRDRIRKYHIGSLAMSVPATGRASAINRRLETVMLLNELQEQSHLPLLIAGDFERGVLPAHLFGTTIFPHAMAFGAAGSLSYAEEFGRITAQESRALGVHWNLFPIADVNSNSANPIIGTRAFGGDAKLVGDLVAAYVRGARANGMLTTAKHFPGHGNTATDSHLAIALVNDDLEGLRATDLPPFQKAIGAGVDAVMTGHVRVLALDPDPRRVATTSPAIVTGLLKNQLGFKGIVVTDALDMAGLTRLYATNIGRAAVDAFKAGNDLLIIPANLDASYKTMLDAARSGEIAQTQIDAAVFKLLKAKASLGLHRARLVDLEKLSTEVGKPENVALGQQISDDAVTLVRDSGRLLPLKQSGTVKGGIPYQRAEEVRNN